MPKQDKTIQEEEFTSPAEGEDEYLTFSLNREEYAVSIMKVKEIRAWEPVTRVPHAQPWECGLVNVRGAIVPIIDLRKRIGLKNFHYDKHTVVVMFNVRELGREKVQGVVVDELTDVVRFPLSSIQQAPQIKKSRSTQFAQGVVEYSGRMIIMLDLIKALGIREEAE
ncbi:chemotaxis protein CheW [Hahella ganghwensis]|uniref:chemotaxis protein CheW n=1 Tax=Hahella ganghwensis TaxID=286420 RepID=UPI0003777AB4|nr:chemotaxis protein CheW [Hahella ganghwensis]